jgi:hypothetical protein
MSLQPTENNLATFASALRAVRRSRATSIRHIDKYELAAVEELLQASLIIEMADAIGDIRQSLAKMDSAR